MATMATGQTTTAGIEAAIKEEITEEDTNKGITMAMTEAEAEADTEEEATLAVAEEAAGDIEEVDHVTFNLIETVILREMMILLNIQIELIMVATTTATTMKSSNPRSPLVPLRRSRKISMW